MRALVPTLIAFASLVSAQAGRVVCSIPEPYSFAKAHQQKDGRWVDYRGRLVTDKVSPRPGSELSTTSLVVLALLGDGSTMHSGWYKDQIKESVRWMLRRIDAQGRIALRPDLRWFTDHALASFAFAEAVRLSKYKSLGKRVLAFSTYLLRYLEREQVTVTPELLFWSLALADSLKTCPPPIGDKLRPTAVRLGAVVARRAKQLQRVAPKTDSERAIRLYFLARRTENPAQSAQVSAAIDADLSRCTKLDTMDPMAVAIYTMAIYRVGGERWKTWTRRVRVEIVKRQLTVEPAHGSWRSPSDSIGPVQTTAWHTITLECYYRYCRLRLVH